MFDPAARTAPSAPGALAGSREICGKIGSHRVGAWHSPVAQSVERLTVNQEVAGSSPARGANQSCRLQNVGGDREIHADVLLTVSLGAPLTMVENPATSRQI